MINLKDFSFIYEELSKSNKKKLDDMVKDGTINNENISTIKTLLDKDKKLSKLNSKEYIDKANRFFEKHGLSKLNWGRGETVISVFNRIFKNNLDKLQEIIDNDGIISFKSLQKEGNLFSICKGFQNEAKSIATITTSGSANAGPCEILLKLILNEGTSASEGDVYLTGIGPLEVKAITKKKTYSGGHAAGQKTKDNDSNTTDIRKSWSIYNYVYANLFDIDWNEANKMANDKKYAFLMNKSAYKDFCSNYIEKFKPSIKDFANVLTEAIMWQYNYLDSNGKDVNRTKLVSPKLKLSVEKELSKIYKNGKLDDDNQKLLDLVGSIQLYLYSLTEEFSYIMFIYYDYNDLDINELNYDESPDLLKGSGYYLKLDKNDLSDISIANSNIQFGVLDSLISTQGRTGKMCFKYLKEKKND